MSTADSANGGLWRSVTMKQRVLGLVSGPLRTSTPDPFMAQNDPKRTSQASADQSSMPQVAQLKFDGGTERREVAFKAVLRVELLIVAEIEEDSPAHQDRVVDHVRSNPDNAALEWAKPGA